MTDPGSAPPPGGPDERRSAARGNQPAADTTISIGALTSADTTEQESGLTPADHSAIDALPEASALLVVQRGPNAGARFLLDADKTTAGRRPDSDIFLDDVTVSRKHAEFHRTPRGEFVVRDVGSLNGTYVGRDRVDEAVLKDGDEVQIGKYRLVFHPSRRPGG